MSRTVELGSIDLLLEVVPGARPGLAMDELRQAILPTVVRWGGTLVEEGASPLVHLRFGRPADAVAALPELRQSLGAHLGGRSTGVRIAIGPGATANDDPWAVEELQEQTAALLSMAHGGQILLGGSMAAILAPLLPPGAQLTHLGAHRLADLRSAVEVVQYLDPAEACTDLSLHSLERVPNNLPIQLTSFIGRRQTIQYVQELLQGTRLVTLTGPGGSGKTRIGLQVAARLLEQFPEGVWFVDLSNLSDPALVPATIAAVLRVSEEAGRPVMETLMRSLAQRRLLLLLDNCEHLIMSCARLVNQLLASCSQVTVLTTSREPLGIPGEVNVPIAPLPAPESGQVATAARLTSYEAARLFVQRARAVNPTFVVTDQNAEALAVICRRLDGIPLAIELAAARTRVLSLEQIRERLDDRLQLLTAGRSTTLSRHQTLRAALDWSYDLLTPEEQTLWRRLAIFAGSFGLAAAETVCSGMAIDQWMVLDLLSQLVERSLIVTEEQQGQKRFRMLESIRQYGRSRWEEGDEDRLYQAHCDWYVRQLEETRPDQFAQAAWLDQMELDHDNLRQAIQWAMESDQLDRAYRLCGGLLNFWYQRYYLGEGWSRLIALAERTDPQVSPAARARVLNGAGALASELGETKKATVYLEEALQLFRDLGDQVRTAAALNNLGLISFQQGSYDAALRYMEEAIQLNQRLDLPLREAWSRANYAWFILNLGNSNDSRAHAEESLALMRREGEAGGIAIQMLGEIALAEGNLTQARRHLTEASSTSLSVGDRRGYGAALTVLGELSIAERQYEQAHAHLIEALQQLQGAGDQVGILRILEALCGLAAQLGNAEIAARLAGGVTAQTELTTFKRSPMRQTRMESWLAPAYRALSPEAAAAAGEEGARLSLEALLELATGSWGRPAPALAEAAQTETTVEPIPLSAREQQVVKLLAAGLTAKEIGQQLFLSPRTVEKHEENVRHKLGVPNRAALITWAAQHGLA